MPNIWQRMRNAFARPAYNGPQQTAQLAPFFNVVAETDTTPAEVYFYGDVCENPPVDWWTGEPEPGDHIALAEVKEKLEGIRNASAITIHLNSSGGDLFAGIAIHNLLRSFAGDKTVIVEGLAASAASLIMCAGNTVKVHPGSMVMIHNVASFMCGFYSTPELRELLTSHEAAEQAIVNIYEGKCGKKKNELQALIDATTWFVGAEAVEEGFADELITDNGNEDEPADDVVANLSPDGTCLMVAGVPHLLSNLGALPPWLANKTGIREGAPAPQGHIPVGGAEQTPAPQVEEEGDMPITNAAELRSTYPELVAEVERDAVATERERMRSISEIANKVRDHQLVNRAMFDEPMTAAELALEAMKTEGGNPAFIDDLDADAQNAADGEVEPNPAEQEDEDTDEKKETEQINEMVQLYNKLKGSR